MSNVNNIPLVTHISDNCQKDAINTAILSASRFLGGYEEDETKQGYTLVKYTGTPGEFKPEVNVHNVYWIGNSGAVSMIVGCSDSNGTYIKCPTNVSCTIYSVEPSESYKCSHYYVTDCWHGIDGVCCCGFVSCYCVTDNQTCNWREYCMLCYFFLCRVCTGPFGLCSNCYCVFPFRVKTGVSCIDMTDSVVNVYQKVLG